MGQCGRMYAWTAVVMVAVTVLEATQPTQSDWLALERETLEPWEIQHRNGRVYRGTIVSLDDNNEWLEFAIQEEQGSLEVWLRISEIKRVIPAGSGILAELVHSRMAHDARECYRILYRAWGRYLTLLDDQYLQGLLPLAELELQAGDPQRAIRVARKLLARIQDFAARRQLEEVILLSYHSMRLDRETERLAGMWVDAQGEVSNSALGYWVLGDIALYSGNYEEALGHALQGIVRHGLFTVDYLEECYRQAITAAQQLGEPEYGQILRQEMRERGMDFSKTSENE